MPPRKYWGVKCHLRLLGCQMPHRDYWGIKYHIGIIGVQRPHGPRKRIQNGIQKRLQKLNILQCKCSQKIIIDLISGIFVKQNSKMGSIMGSKRDSRMKEQNGTSMQEIPGKLFCKIQPRLPVYFQVHSLTIIIDVNIVLPLLQTNNNYPVQVNV